MRYSKEGWFLRDSITLFERCIMLAFRSPGAIGLAFIAPASIMAVFVYVFGGALDIGDVSVVDYIVPGVVLLTIGQSAAPISVRFNNDMTKGVIDRFRAMPIAKSSILIGHVTATVLQNVISVAATIGVSLLVGFRPQAGLIDWLMAAGIMLLYIIAIMWLTVFVGLFAKDSEGASSMMTLLGTLPFLSSGFTPTDTMPVALRIFAENQPMTPIINSVRALLLGELLDDRTLQLALFWCVLMIVIFYISALLIYKRRTTK
ncbi:MAG: ABC transporter permease [Oscillospiraceae bacterium]|nr:ABC transporter permease [Oscillospiraceae bacterium]